MPGDPFTWLTYAALGVFVGFFSGLLGIGGGSMIVPILGLTFVAFGFPAEQVMHLALGTSLAAILLASASGAREHHLHGAVRVDILRGLTPGILAAGLVAGAVVRFAPVPLLKYFFLAFVSYVTIQILFGRRPSKFRPMPGRGGLFAVGALIGGASGLAGVGGAMISVPFMTAWGVAFHAAIGTSTAISFMVAVAGTLGYAIAGFTDHGMPAWTLGYIYVPALVGISVTSVLVAPWSARLAHRLPVPILKKVFAVFLLALAVKLIASL
jgi:uncharacterized membrane protein YfcA